MTLHEKLELYGNMILSCHKLYLWTYGADMQLISTNCPDSALIGALFTLENKCDELRYYSEGHKKPIIMANSFGLMWIAVPERDAQNLSRIYLLGPFFVDSVRTEAIQQSVSRLDMSGEVKLKVMQFLRELPVVGLGHAFEYAIMLYHCIYGETIGVSDMHYLESEPIPEAKNDEARTRVHGTYELEREVLRMVKDGDLNYKEKLSRLAMTGTMGQMSNGDPSRQMKNAVIVCAILFSRAAIDGGLSPEVALTLTDKYFQSIEASRTMSELSEVAFTMQEDFVRRVHRIRSRSLSSPISECCDYIDFHIEENITLEQLSEKVRYSGFYLSRKFKEETGKSIKEYIRLKKLERAKDMLRDNTLTVKEIGERLGFCSQSYLTEQFKREYGATPSQWREIEYI